MPFLDAIAHEFKPGYLPKGSPLTSVIKQPDIDLGDGKVIPGGQTVVTHQEHRPSFITAYLASLPSALGGALQNANQPYSGFASGLGGGAAQINADEQRNKLVQHNQDQENFENRIKLEQLGLSREHIKLERDKTNAQKHFNTSEVDLALAKAGGDESAGQALDILKAQRDKPPTEKSPKTVQTGEGVFILNEDGTLGTRLGSTPAAAAREDKPPTQAELSAFGFATRLMQADANLRKVEDEIASSGLVGQARTQYAPNALQTEKEQLYNQGRRQFAEARLRKESGANINVGEFDNDRRQYIVVAGDGPQVIEQKRAARTKLIKSFLLGSGKANTPENVQAILGDQPVGASSELKIKRDKAGRIIGIE